MNSPVEFQTTHWSMVRRAGEECPHERDLAELCRLYWKPLYHFARAQQLDEEAARDAVQDFFAGLLGNNYLSRADATKGRFRSFLMGAFRHQLLDAHDRRMAQKRGGGIQFIPMDGYLEETIAHPSGGTSPEEVYDRQWALSVLATASHRLRERMEADGHGARLAILEPFLSGRTPEMSYGKAAELLGVDVGRVKTWIHRLRQRRASLIREVVGETVPTLDEVEAELRHLLSVIG